MGEARPISRRQALAALGTVGASALIGGCGADESGNGAAQVTTQEGARTTVPARTPSAELAALFDESPACRVTPEQTEGPFYFDVDRIRSDIREDRAGTPLEVALRVRDARCEPVADAIVELWQADAGGVYSGFESGEGDTFLRGAQVTNEDGVVRFQTIYPGWYPGRSPHIHARVIVDNERALTTQLYFDDRASATVFERDEYSGRSGEPTTNDADFIFVADLEMALRERDQGYLGLLTLDLA